MRNNRGLIMKLTETEKIEIAKRVADALKDNFKDLENDFNDLKGDVNDLKNDFNEIKINTKLNAERFNDLSRRVNNSLSNIDEQKNQNLPIINIATDSGADPSVEF